MEKKMKMARPRYFYEVTISSSPHVHSPVTTQTIMRDVLIGLLPAMVGAVYFFGLRALAVTLVSAASCVFFEYIWCALAKKKNPVGDLSAVVTGIILAMNLPASLPIWMGIVLVLFPAMQVPMAVKFGSRKAMWAIVVPYAILMAIGYLAMSQPRAKARMVI